MLNHHWSFDTVFSVDYDLLLASFIANNLLCVDTVPLQGLLIKYIVKQLHIHRGNLWYRDATNLTVKGNSFPPEENGCHFPDIFKCIFVKEKYCISIRILLSFVSMLPINNDRALVQVMTWHRADDTSLPNADPLHWCIYAALGAE